MKQDQSIISFFANVAAQRSDALREYFTPDAVIRWHNTNEQFTVEEYIRANCEYPGQWRGRVERVEHGERITIAVARVWLTDHSAAYHVTSFFEFFEGKIVLLDEYWGDDGSAPQWRLDKQIGRYIPALLAQDDKLRIEAFAQCDLPYIACIYNSNPSFLQQHLGVTYVDNQWVEKEQADMADTAFCTAMVIDRTTGCTVGFCDYSLGKQAYLSLLMLEGSRKGCGLGRVAYQLLEQYFASYGACSVRIDVVYDYPDTPIGFWEGCGFLPQEVIPLEWHGKCSNAYKMVKQL